MPVPLATQADYELLIGPVDVADEPKLDVYLGVASGIVYGKAPLLLGDQYQGDPNALPDPIPPDIPETATLVTCQVAYNLMSSPTGAVMAQTERVGFVQTQYADISEQDALLPMSWKLLLKPWRYPELASIVLDSPQRFTYIGPWASDYAELDYPPGGGDNTGSTP